MTIVCKHCSLPAEDHHDFEPQMPDGCICDPFAWFGAVNDICGNYVDQDPADLALTDECVTCSHEKGCHKS